LNKTLARLQQIVKGGDHCPWKWPADRKLKSRLVNAPAGGMEGRVSCGRFLEAGHGEKVGWQ
jgi:hypothetical protein